MKLRLALAACAAAFACASAAADADLQLQARQPFTLEGGNAIAAFAVDASIADVAVAAGRVVLVGRRAGQTVVTVVFPAGVRSFLVRVQAAPVILAAEQLAAQQRGGFVEARYDSALQRLATVVSGRGRAGDWDVAAQAEVSHQLAPSPGEGSNALTAGSIEFTKGQRSVALLDKFVQESPLTLDGVMLRGVHVREPDLEFHAGIASWSPLQGFLASGGERAMSVSRAFALGGLRVVPRAAWFPDSRSAAKVVAAVSLEFGGEADALSVRGDAGVGGAAAAALDVDWRMAQRQAWARWIRRPPGFAAPAGARPAGQHAEGAWTEKLGESTTLSASGSASGIRTAESRDARVVAARAELREQLSPNLAATVGAGGGDYRSGESAPVRRTTVQAGLAWEESRWGVNAQVRHQSLSSAGGGHGGRVSAWAHVDAWKANAFVDAQQQAPTLDLLLHDRNEVARTLAALGIVAAQPEDMLRALRDNAGLLAAGGVTIGPVRLSPLRVQGGADLSWHGGGPARPHLGARVLREVMQGVVGGRGSTLVSLHGGWRVGERTDVGIALTRWTLQTAAQTKAGDIGVRLTLRTYFDQPLLAGQGAAIRGQVIVAPPQETDAPNGSPEAVAGVEVVLDGSRRTRTGPDGRFEFERPGPGAHTIEAILPAGMNAYFTTPSSVTREAGGSASFGIGRSGVQLKGSVVDDAGMPVAGVRVQAQGVASASAVTDSSGAYRFTLPPGEAVFAIAAETVPPGFDLRALATRRRTLALGAPATVNFVLRANRAIEGRVIGKSGSVVVSIPEISREVATDADGRFMLRRVPPGRVTLMAADGERRVAQSVDVPAAAGVVRGVQLLLR